MVSAAEPASGIVKTFADNYRYSFNIGQFARLALAQGYGGA
ncbi:MAG: hypothetical protein ACI9LV_000224 [Candidatus Nanohaloarchaea archaeon]|jgi:hypothetical protein